MSHKTPAPTPPQIAAACLQIQSTWSEEVRLRRLRCDLRPVVLAADGRLLPVDAEDYAVSTARCPASPVSPLDVEPE